MNKRQIRDLEEKMVKEFDDEIKLEIEILEDHNPEPVTFADKTEFTRFTRWNNK